MCNILIPDSLNRLWQLGCSDAGMLTTALTGFNFPVGTASLRDPQGNAWQLGVTVSGIIRTSPITTGTFPLAFLVLNSPSGLRYKLTINSAGVLRDLISDTAIDSLPTQVDVTMSSWPPTSGVICPRCNNANVTVMADMANWCCVCQDFVDPEDTTILVVLSE